MEQRRGLLSSVCYYSSHFAPTVGPEAGVEGVSVPVEAVGEMSDSQPQTVSA